MKGVKGFQKGHKIWADRKHSKETLEKMSASAKRVGTGRWFKGIKLSEEHKEKIGASRRGSKHPMFGKKHKISSRIKASMALKGERNHQWRGGVTNEGKKLRNSLEYKLWRESVFERDNFTCQFCKKRGGDIEADHIRAFAYFPVLRFDINNGRTLCVPCHKTTFSYLKNQRV